MIIWSYAPNSDHVDFVLSALDPDTGNVYSKLDGRMYPPTSFIDPESFIIHSTARFSAPAQGIFYSFIDEHFLPDGKYAIIATPVGGNDPITNYEARVVGGREQLLSIPAQLASEIPPLAIVTGRELGPNGLPLAGVRICAILQTQTPQGQTTSGTVTGEVCTVSAIDGTWTLSLIPSTAYGPGATYIFTKSYPGFGQITIGPVSIPASGPVSLDHLQILANISELAVTPPFVETPLAAPAAGYCLVTGRIVDMTGKPVPSVLIKIGAPNPYQRDWAYANSHVTGEVVEPQLLLEHVTETTTAPNLVKTQSFLPGPGETLTATLEESSELITIVDGRGGVLSPPADFSFDRTTWVVTFSTPFFGVVKYRVPSNGRFSMTLLSGLEYWIQAGQRTARRHFTIPPGATSFDVSALVLPL